MLSVFAYDERHPIFNNLNTTCEAEYRSLVRHPLLAILVKLIRATHRESSLQLSNYRGPNRRHVPRITKWPSCFGAVLLCRSYDIKSAGVEVEACEQGRTNRPYLQFCSF